MSDENVNAIRALYDAYRRKDIGAISNIFHPDIDIFQSEQLPWGGRFRGPEGAQEYFGKIMSNVDSEVHLERVIDAGEHVVAIGRSVGKVHSNGNLFELNVAHVYQMQDGKALTCESYIDNPQMLEALTL